MTDVYECWIGMAKLSTRWFPIQCRTITELPALDFHQYLIFAYYFSFLSHRKRAVVALHRSNGYKTTPGWGQFLIWGYTVMFFL